MKKRQRIYEPPSHVIDWAKFSEVVQGHWTLAHDIHKELGGGKVTAYRAWRGEPIGVIPFLRICKITLHDPYEFLVAR